MSECTTNVTHPSVDVPSFDVSHLLPAKDSLVGQVLSEVAALVEEAWFFGLYETSHYQGESLPLLREEVSRPEQ